MTTRRRGTVPALRMGRRCAVATSATNEPTGIIQRLRSQSRRTVDPPPPGQRPSDRTRAGGNRQPPPINLNAQVCNWPRQRRGRNGFPEPPIGCQRAISRLGVALGAIGKAEGIREQRRILRYIATLRSLRSRQPQAASRHRSTLAGHATLGASHRQHRTFRCGRVGREPSAPSSGRTGMTCRGASA